MCATARSLSFSLAVGCLFGFACLTGCQTNGTNPLPDGSNGLPGTNAGGSAVPKLQFQSPTSSTVITDNNTASIRYTVTTDRALTGRLVLDLDATPNNGNEVVIASDRTFNAPGGTDDVQLTAGQYPYGTYFIRATLSDGTQSYDFPAFGLMNIVPLVNNQASNPDGNIAVLSDVAGLRLLHTSGSPGSVNSRIPFVATWDYPDYVDNGLRPIYVAPFEIKQTIEVRRMQFYAYGHTDVEAKKIKLYQGTDENSQGTLLQEIEASLASFPTGGWTLIPVDPPITLQPGKYGISYHSKFEFGDNWAGNAAAGAGFAWVQQFLDTPYSKTTAADVGFTPNFAFRLLGKLVPEQAAPSPNGRLLIPTPLDPIYPDNDAKPPEGLGDKGTGDEDTIGAASPYHITWQLAGE